MGLVHAPLVRCLQAFVFWLLGTYQEQLSQWGTCSLKKSYSRLKENAVVYNLNMFRVTPPQCGNSAGSKSSLSLMNIRYCEKILRVLSTILEIGCLKSLRYK